MRVSIVDGGLVAAILDADGMPLPSIGETVIYCADVGVAAGAEPVRQCGMVRHIENDYTRNEVRVWVVPVADDDGDGVSQ